MQSVEVDRHSWVSPLDRLIHDSGTGGGEAHPYYQHVFSTEPAELTTEIIASSLPPTTMEVSMDDYSSLSDRELEELFKQTDYLLSTDIWKDLPQWEVAIKILFYILIISVSLVGNSLVIIVLLKKRSLRCVTNLFILNLALSDILVTCTSTWVHLLDDLMAKWLLGAVFCRLNVFMQVASLVSSVLTMTAIATERFFGIVTPFVFCMKQKKVTVAAVILIWLIAITVATPPTLFTSLKTRQWRNYEEVWCSVVWPIDVNDGTTVNSRGLYYTVVAILLYMLPLFIMTNAYIAIIIKLRAKNPTIIEINNNSQKAKNNSRRKVVVMLIILLAVFTLCWLPFQISMLHYEYTLHKTSEIPDWWHDFSYYAHFMSDANSACNPVIFVCFSQKIRKAIYSLLCQHKKLLRTPSSRFGSTRSSTRKTWV